jgi:transcriptional antiterminator NusG
MNNSSKRYNNETKEWYVIHTYSGYEEKVAESIKQRIESLDMNDKIFEVLVPREKMIEIKNGKRRVVEKKIFQGYVLINMKLSEDTWYVVRNTPGVTGFVGSGNEPTPVEKDEIEKINKRMGREQPKYQINFTVGDVVNIIDGPFKSFDGSISDIDQQKGKLKVLVNMFGRETPVELDSLQVKKV